MSPPIVVNLYRENFDLYIGRPGAWGNPFKIGKNGTREEVIELYEFQLRQEIKRKPGLEETILSLAGKRLGCHCSPAPCHGDVIVRIFNEITEKKKAKVHTEWPFPRGGEG